MRLLTLKRAFWLVAIIALPAFAFSQPLKNDTVKVKAIVSSFIFPGDAFLLPKKDSSGIKGIAFIIRGYAVYKVEWDRDDIDPGFDRREQRKVYKLLNHLYPNKRDTLTYVYDYKEFNW